MIETTILSKSSRSAVALLQDAREGAVIEETRKATIDRWIRWHMGEATHHRGKSVTDELQDRDGKMWKRVRFYVRYPQGGLRFFDFLQCFFSEGKVPGAIEIPCFRKICHQRTRDLPTEYMNCSFFQFEINREAKRLFSSSCPSFLPPRFTLQLLPPSFLLSLSIRNTK